MTLALNDLIDNFAAPHPRIARRRNNFLTMEFPEFLKYPRAENVGESSTASIVRCVCSRPRYVCYIIGVARAFVGSLSDRNLLYLPRPTTASLPRESLRQRDGELYVMLVLYNSIRKDAFLFMRFMR